MPPGAPLYSAEAADGQQHGGVSSGAPYGAGVPYGAGAPYGAQSGGAQQALEPRAAAVGAVGMHPRVDSSATVEMDDGPELDGEIEVAAPRRVEVGAP